MTFEDDAVRAVTCAIKMMDEIDRMNSDIPETGRKISVGIGISTGEVMAGIFGSSRKKEYTVMGPTVNVASRLEKLARARQILICGGTYSEVRDIVRAENMGPVMLKGMDRKIDIYNIVGLK